MLDEDSTVPARSSHNDAAAGSTGSLTILKDHLHEVRLSFCAASASQRTSCEPGELAQTDWRGPGISVEIGRGQAGRCSGW
jgi:hypothetical protein